MVKVLTQLREFTRLFYRRVHRSKGTQLYEILLQLLYGQSNDSKARVSSSSSKGVTERCSRYVLPNGMMLKLIMQARMLGMMSLDQAMSMCWFTELQYMVAIVFVEAQLCIIST